MQRKRSWPDCWAPLRTRKNIQEPESKGGFGPLFPGSCELVGAVEFEIVAARVHAVSACRGGGDNLQRYGPL